MATFKGLLTEDFGKVQVTDKFAKREFVLDEVTSYNGNESHNPVKFQLVNEKCELLDGCQKGQEVTVEFAPKGNRVEKDGKVSFFVNLNAWKADFVKRESPAQPSANVEDAKDGLPF